MLPGSSFFPVAGGSCFQNLNSIPSKQICEHGQGWNLWVCAAIQLPGHQLKGTKTPRKQGRWLVGARGCEELREPSAGRKTEGLGWGRKLDRGGGKVGTAESARPPEPRLPDYGVGGQLWRPGNRPCLPPASLLPHRALRRGPPGGGSATATPGDPGAPLRGWLPRHGARGVSRTGPRVPNADPARDSPATLQPNQRDSSPPLSRVPFPAPEVGSPSRSGKWILSGPQGRQGDSHQTLPPPDPRRYSPRPSGPPSPPSQHCLPSCSLRPGTSLSGHRRSPLRGPSDSFLFPPSPPEAPPPGLAGSPARPHCAGASAAALSPSRSHPEAGGAEGGEAETMATRSLTSALQKLGCHGNKAVLVG